MVPKLPYKKYPERLIFCFPVFEIKETFASYL